MRKILVVLLILILSVLSGTPNVTAADLYNGTTNNTSLAGNSAMNLPDGDWTMTIWVKFTSRAGSSQFHWLYFFAPGTQQVLVRIGDASAPGAVDDINFSFTDDDGTNIAVEGSWNPFQSNTSWTLVRLERSVNTITAYANGGSGGGTNANFDAVTINSSFYIGGKSNNTEGLNASLAEFGKWDRVLTAGEVTSLLKGYSPGCIKNGLKVYEPKIRNYQEIRTGIAVTNSGSTITDHPPIIYCN